ncbi:MAG: GNAT family N-acetyltransferase [Thermodesulfobacteriota bacterium]
MTNHDLIYLADLNYAESMRETARWATNSKIIEQDDLLLIAGGGSTPQTNSAIRVGNHAGPPAEEVMERIETFFGNRKPGYSLHVRRHLDSDLEILCQSAKLMKISDTPGMAVHEPILIKELPADFKIKSIEDETGAADFASVAIDSFHSLGMSVEFGKNIFEKPERMLRPYNYLAVVYVNERPVSCAMIVFSHSIAGIYWVGTIESFRKKGLAEVCTATVTNEAFRRGASSVILQASPFGEPIYRRLGFKEFTRYLWYMHFHKE